MKHENGEVGYIASTRKELRCPTGIQKEECTYLVDTLGDELTGYSEIVYATVPQYEQFREKPFVARTRTLGERRQGLGTRRVEEMNAFTQAQYGLPLYSDTNQTDEAKALWEKLVATGRAKKYKEGGKNDRYVFEK